MKPHPGSLSWVEGDVPTPHGTIDVRWAQDRTSGRLALQVTAPTGTRGTISVPVLRPDTVVTVRTGGSGRTPPLHRVVTAAPGATSVAITVPGGATYDIDAVPR